MQDESVDDMCMRNGLLGVLLLVLLGCTDSATSSYEPEQVIREVLAAEEAFVSSERAGDLEAQAELLADDYVYIDISGKRVTKPELLERRRGDKRYVPDLVASEVEVVPLTSEYAISRGQWESTSSYYGGLPRSEVDRYTAVWVKRDGRWQILADQVTPMITREYPVKQRILLTDEDLIPFEGTYQLDVGSNLRFSLRAVEGRLIFRIPGEIEDMDFFPASPNSFFAIERPFELRFEADDSLVVTTWGVESLARRSAVE